MKDCRDGVVGATFARLVRRLVYTLPSSLHPGRDTAYMVHPRGGKLEVGKGSQHQVRIGFWSFSHVVQYFRQQLLFEITLLILRGSVFPHRRYAEVCMKVVCGQEDLAYVSF
jgi:hypothetical protein